MRLLSAPGSDLPQRVRFARPDILFAMSILNLTASGYKKTKDTADVWEDMAERVSVNLIER